jgi:hypothetical protein
MQFRCGSRFRLVPGPWAAAAAPIHPMQRGAFLQASAKELELHPVVGPGVVHRAAADLQRHYVIALERETSQGARQASR